jgi:hypothetical protein
MRFSIIEELQRAVGLFSEQVMHRFTNQPALAGTK